MMVGVCVCVCRQKTHIAPKNILEIEKVIRRCIGL